MIKRCGPGSAFGGASLAEAWIDSDPAGGGGSAREDRVLAEPALLVAPQRRYRSVAPNDGEVTSRVMAQPDTKQSEKDYLRRAGGGEWELSKPFPAPGEIATADHAQLLLDFAVLLRVLAPGPSDLVLDLGAGSCWVSEWLRRCGVRTVALDISFDMLSLGAARLGTARGLAVGDMEHLPFADNAFSKACCLNAFHHIPDTPGALGEIKRVLSADGIVFFSEPGVGHASHPASVAASRNYGVLENEIRIDEFMESCLAAGFADVRLHPISHVMPLFDLKKEQWDDWRTFTASKRPFRALSKMWRAILEVAGLGKRNVLFEEAFAIRLLRELQPIIEQHPVVTAHRGPFVKPTLTLDAAVIELVNPPSQVPAGRPVLLRVRLRNAGTTRWETSPTAGQVRVGVQLLSADHHVINRDYSRHELPAPLDPGARCELVLRVAAPSSMGTSELKVDLVREGVTWFELTGSVPATHRIEVV
jgi:ubiquinone/menaquinone biosynthesis C-methylase UbiE